MADTIAIMNQGVIEQLGAPQEVYDRPASVFVADFIGSPAMNFLPLRRRLRRRRAPGARSATRALRGARAARGRAGRRAAVAACGPSTCASTTDSALRAEVLGTEYLGTQPDRHLPHRAGRDAARQGRRRDVPAQRGDPVGLAFDAAQVSLFDRRQRPRAAHRAPRRSRSRAAHAPAPLGAAHG